MPNLDAMNDPDLCTNTPIGDLVVVMWGGKPAVAMKDRHDPEGKPARVIHMVENGGVLGALYGKRFWEQRAHRDLYREHAETLEKRHQRFLVDHRKDTQREIRKLLQREGGREAVLRKLAR